MIAILDRATGLARIASTGAEPPWLLPARDADAPIAGCQGILIGAAPPHEAVYQMAEQRLESGDLLLLFTDGVSEARNRGPAGPFFGPDRAAQEAQRLREAVTAKDGRAYLQNIADGLVRAATDFCGSGGLCDDACFLLARWSP